MCSLGCMFDLLCVKFVLTFNVYSHTQATHHTHCHLLHSPLPCTLMRLLVIPSPLKRLTVVSTRPQG